MQQPKKIDELVRDQHTATDEALLDEKLGEFCEYL